ncbi:hypothetical protein HK096_004540, partial [Nowakowskiella sp. JEL0078]
MNQIPSNDRLVKWKRISNFSKGLATDIVLGDLVHYSKDSRFKTTMNQDYYSFFDGTISQKLQVPNSVPIYDPSKIQHPLTLQIIDALRPAGKPGGGNPYKTRFEQHIILGDANISKFVGSRNNKILKSVSDKKNLDVPKISEPILDNAEYVPKKRGTYKNPTGMHFGLQTKANLPVDNFQFNNFLTTTQSAYMGHSASSIAICLNEPSAGSTALARKTSTSNIPQGDLEKLRTFSTVAMESWKPIPKEIESSSRISKVTHGLPLTLGDHNQVNKGMYTTTSGKTHHEFNINTSSSTIKRTDPKIHTTLMQMLKEKMDEIPMSKKNRTAFLRSKSSIVFGEVDGINEQKICLEGSNVPIEKASISLHDSGMYKSLKPDSRLNKFTAETSQKSHYSTPSDRIENEIATRNTTQNRAIQTQTWRDQLIKSSIPVGDLDRFRNFETTAEVSFITPPLHDAPKFPAAGLLITRSVFSLGDTAYDTETSIFNNHSPEAPQRLQSEAQSSYAPFDLQQRSYEARAAGCDHSISQPSRRLIGESDVHCMADNHTTQHDHFVSHNGNMPARFKAKPPRAVPNKVLFPPFHDTHTTLTCGRSKKIDILDSFYCTSNNRVFGPRDGIYNAKVDHSAEEAAKFRERRIMTFGDPRFWSVGESAKERNLGAV